MLDSDVTRPKLDGCYHSSKKHTSWFADDARPPIPSEPYIIGPFGMLFICCMLPVIPDPSIGVCVDGVDGCELDGPTVFPVPVLLAGPEEEGPFLLRLFYQTHEASSIILQIQTEE